MKEDVRVRMKTRQVQPPEAAKEEPFEMTAEGVWRRGDTEHRLIFHEPEGPGGEKVRDTVIVEEAACRIRRAGAVNTELHFVPEETRPCVYETEVGAVELSLRTKKLARRIWDDRLMVHIEYEVLAGEDVVSAHIVDIKAERVK